MKFKNGFDGMPDGFARLAALHPKKIDLSLGRMERVLRALDHPERDLPKVIHVAGTNGKGSVIAFLRALIEAAGKKAHIYTSPHLIRFNERIVLAGQEIADEVFIEHVAQVERANEGLPLTFFEAMTAAAFLAFREVEADFCLLETGLGGRLDATNMISDPAMTIIMPVSYDHQAFLGERLEQIAAEKAGIIKPHAPVILAAQKEEAFSVIAARAAECGSRLFYQDRDWRAHKRGDGFVYQYGKTAWDLPLPSLPGEHQIINAGCALMATHLLELPLSQQRAADALWKTEWPARLQKLSLRSFNLPPTSGADIFLDGGHNPAAGEALARFLRQEKKENSRPIFLICAMRQTKNMRDFLKNFLNIISGLYAVPLPMDHQVPGEGAGAYEPDEMVVLARGLGMTARSAFDVGGALNQILNLEINQKARPLILIAGSLLLAGDVLAQVEFKEPL